MRTTIRVIGTQIVVKNLGILSLKATQAVRDATLKVAYMVMNDAKTLSPVDTGRLRASISVNWSGSNMQYGKVQGRVEARAGRKSSTAADGIGQPPSSLKGFSAAVGTNVEYAENVEDSISPFLWPALAMNKEKYRAMLGIALKAQLAGFSGGGRGSFFGKPL